MMKQVAMSKATGKSSVMGLNVFIVFAVDRIGVLNT